MEHLFREWFSEFELTSTVESRLCAPWHSTVLYMYMYSNCSCTYCTRIALHCIPMHLNSIAVELPGHYWSAQRRSAQLLACPRDNCMPSHRIASARILFAFFYVYCFPHDCSSWNGYTYIVARSFFRVNSYSIVRSTSTVLCLHLLQTPFVL